ncbi:5-dehydro-4-deoxy-D-glucuronate isomerase [Acidaminobacter sp. JC074]|uniref:5-dehydro-4-deoxy-D-glucuronate isomerase n=1 Tax=Acidaminobacter sp. JC074 TaxID=2530199 RepID=UPI001F11393B|nr:5-dehydro-4-deoxy-D-glucuronate isomerase [Acidaminobacter sp. JC074]MCH4886182.1 5-dehydro-4-deoxy-D-glucuronate isomerase [Acidaminobacter sp. JC074]
MDIRYASHPSDAKHYDTKTMREQFLIKNLFTEDNIAMTYSHIDRIITAGAMPVNEILEMTASKELGVTYFLERREMGLINIGGPGKVYLDEEVFDMASRDGLYIGMGTKKVAFESLDPTNPAKFYINSAPAHQSYKTVKIEIEKASPSKLGEAAKSNERTIYKYVHPDVCQSCQLLMGLTMLEPNNMWNTMPCHTHDRRMEVYFYFDMKEEDVVFHLMGEVDETRHLVMRNEEAVISPSWSIHSGVGTGSYTFIWGMVGENQTFDDMDHISMRDLK